MKKTIIIIVFCVAMAASVATLIAITIRQSREISRLVENFRTEVSGDRSVQQAVTKAELKELFSDELATLGDYGIKPRQVENVINVEYHYIDTVRYRDTLVWVYDTVIRAHRTPFEIDGDCYSISGEIYADTLEIGCYQSNDEILLSLYKEKRKCLFEKRKVRAIAISACKGDTLAILRNLKVVK